MTIKPMILLITVFFFFPGLIFAKPNLKKEVEIVTISFAPNTFKDQKIFSAIENEAKKGADLILLPETWQGQNEDPKVKRVKQSIEVISQISKKHKTYIIHPVDFSDKNGVRTNQAILFNRNGEIEGIYKKNYPYEGERNFKKKVKQGDIPGVFSTDFGKIGIGICFDVNFSEYWLALEKQGVDFVFWPSAYSAGKHLGAYATIHHYYVISSSYEDSQFFDITGERLIQSKKKGIRIIRKKLNLNREIFHETPNADRIRRWVKSKEELTIENVMKEEEWIVVNSSSDKFNLKEEARKMGFESLREHVNKSRKIIKKSKK